MKVLEIGRILKPQGIRGELKVQPFTDTAEDLAYYKEVWIGERGYRVLSFRTGGGAAYFGLRGVPDRNAAELLRGAVLSVPYEEKKPLPDGQYYVADLLGCEVQDESGARIGELTDVTQAATDIYTVRAGEREILFPAADGVVLRVDVENKKVVVDRKRFSEVAV